jgi:hypothetical protein
MAAMMVLALLAMIDWVGSLPLMYHPRISLVVAQMPLSRSFL